MIAACMQQFEQYYEIFLKKQDLSLLKDAYNERLAGIGGTVSVLGTQEQYSGISEGIDEMGELLVRREDGRIETVYAGEVSVRGIYGYV